MWPTRWTAFCTDCGPSNAPSVVAFGYTRGEMWVSRAAETSGWNENRSPLQARRPRPPGHMPIGALGRWVKLRLTGNGGTG